MGTLQKGDRLPTVKEVVRMVVINPNTVFKAYRELEGEGLIEGRTGSGTFVRARPAGPAPSIQAELAAEADHWIAKARAAGLDEELIEALLRSALHNVKEGKHE